MIVLAVVTKENRKVLRGRATGNTIEFRQAIAVDKYNIVFADSTSDAFVGRKFYPHFKMLFENLQELGVDPEEARKTLVKAVAYAFDRTDLGDDMTVAQIDEEFKISSRIENSDGALSLYQTLKDRWCKDNDCDTGDLILWEVD